MILYFAPGACSLADHIALHEANMPFDRVKVDLKTHRTETGEDYTAINPKGYVPALILDGGARLTENIAILSWIADQAPSLAPGGDFARYRLLEALSFVSTEIHKAFKPLFSPDADEPARQAARETVAQRLGQAEQTFAGDFLLGDHLTLADAYLFVMLTWAEQNRIPIPPGLAAYMHRIAARPAVQLALKHEGLA